MGNIAYIAGATRSGSTYIKSCISGMGFVPISAHVCLQGYYNEEHMVDPRILSALGQGKFVILQHSRAIGHNVPVLEEFGVRPIVTYRNIYDSVVSFKESTDIDFANGGDSGTTHLPLHFPKWNSMDEIEKFLWVAYNVVPWWVQHLASWKNSGLDCLFVDYDEFFADKVVGLRRIFAHLGVPATDAMCEIIADSARGKFNKGIPGRGANLPPLVKEICDTQRRLYGEK